MRGSQNLRLKSIYMTIIALILATGCATREQKAIDISLRCDQPNKPFQSFVFCTELTLMGFMDDPKVRSYVLEGKALLERVKSGELTESSARREWQRAYPF